MFALNTELLYIGVLNILFKEDSSQQISLKNTVLLVFVYEERYDVIGNYRLISAITTVTI